MQWATRITDVKPLYSLRNSPAAVDRVTGIFYFNPMVWYTLTDEEKKFVIEHEIGHIDGRTTDEEQADAIASERHFKKGNSLKASVLSLAKVLPAGHPRITKQLLRAEQYDSQTKTK